MVKNSSWNPRGALRLLLGNNFPDYPGYTGYYE